MRGYAAHFVPIFHTLSITQSIEVQFRQFVLLPQSARVIHRLYLRGCKSAIINTNIVY